jgi:hypothetical protein
LIGCFKGSLFKTTRWIEQWVCDGTIGALSNARVTVVDPRSRRLAISVKGGESQTIGPYDRIYIAAGCLGSTMLLMDSLGIDQAVMKDTSVVNTPIVFLGAQAEPVKSKGGFGLAHGLALVPDPKANRIVAQVQVYPTLPHFWRSVLPPLLWKAAGYLVAPLQSRMLWARSFLAGEAACRYILARGSNGAIEATLDQPSDRAELTGYVHAHLADALHGSGFRLLDFLASSSRTSSHYGASAPFLVGGDVVDREWQLSDGIYLADSTAWPEMPAMSPTMTIMANAMRIAERSVA